MKRLGMIVCGDCYYSHFGRGNRDGQRGDDD